MRSLCCETSLLRSLCCGNCCETSLLLDLFAVGPLCCVFFFAVRSLCCEMSISVGFLCCESFLLLDVFAAKFPCCETSLP